MAMFVEYAGRTQKECKRRNHRCLGQADKETLWCWRSRLDMGIPVSERREFGRVFRLGSYGRRECSRRTSFARSSTCNGYRKLAELEPTGGNKCLVRERTNIWHL